MEVIETGTLAPNKTRVLQGVAIGGGADGGSTVARVQLRPVDPVADFDQLFPAACAGDSAATWKHMWHGPFHADDGPKFRAYLEQQATPTAADPHAVAYTVCDALSHHTRVGVVVLMNVAPAMRRAEVGGIWYTPTAQRTHINTESITLLLQYAFEELGYRRIEWKCDNANERSKAAALRLGFTFEGIFRKHMIIKGLNRDTAWFSITDEEWHNRVKDNLHSKLCTTTKDKV
eukprot:TRINITY_DN16547_c0_g1_i1.p1 TRINITY_DN16547_c0_g1~~TRINITY_DN16547_c0_g1_i1.p1  ORF type:complete len:232 (-),score=33.85 TRINITY_DN16547_c0_g1_i1:346-1041(-)